MSTTPQQSCGIVDAVRTWTVRGWERREKMVEREKIKCESTCEAVTVILQELNVRKAALFYSLQHHASMNITGKSIRVKFGMIRFKPETVSKFSVRMSDSLIRMLQ